MKKITLWVETGFSNANHETIVEVEDETTEEEIEEMAKEYMYEKIQYGWYEN